MALGLGTDGMALTCWEKICVVLLTAIGLRIIIRVGRVLWNKVIAPYLGLGIDLTTQGKWALVTGATSGLGKAYAKALAEIGLDIVLVSRSLPKLEEVAAEIKQTYGVETRVVEADLTEGQAVYSKVAKATEDLEVGIVVNNAGASYDHPDLITSVPEETIAKVLQLNVAGVTGIAKVMLPGMLERKRGVLINISSASGIMPAPYLSVYSASKAYVEKLTRDLAAEVGPRGVTVQCILPGLVATKMSKIKKPTWTAPSPEKFVESALKTVGIEMCTTGYIPHALMVGFVNGLRCVCDKAAVWLVMRTMLNLRSRAMRRKVKAEERKSPAAGTNEVTN